MGNAFLADKRSEPLDRVGRDEIQCSAALAPSVRPRHNVTLAAHRLWRMQSGIARGREIRWAVSRFRHLNGRRRGDVNAGMHARRR